MIFRQAVPAEVDQAAALRLAFLEEVTGDLGPGREALAAVLKDYFRRRMGKDLHIFVAEEDGTLAAIAILLLLEKPAHPLFPRGRVGEVIGVYTRPESRRRGAARGVLEALIACINRTNCCTLVDGVPLSDLLARRDCRKGKLGILRNFLDNASELVSRRTVGEIRIRSTVDVRSMQKEVDRMSKELRELDEKIQEANWTTELLEG